ncbi:unnamed protein product, partial [Didymodactylos carnosus]
MASLELEQVVAFKYLGFGASDKMSFKPTVDAAIDKIRKSYSKLKWLSKDSSLMNQIVPISMCSLYGQCLYLQDEYSVLCILKSLCGIQLENEKNSRIILQRNSSTFKLVFDSFLTSLQSSKIFLTAALHDPIMQLVMQDDWYYDINPDTSMSRFSKQECLNRFGQPNTHDYMEKLLEKLSERTTFDNEVEQ